MESFKIMVQNPEESELTQQLMFKLGYTWPDKSNDVKHTNEPYLYFSIFDKVFYYSDTGTINYFITHKFHELTFEELLNEIENEII